jgi:signal transduction histidine kinase
MARHSRATEAGFEMEERERELCLEIRDNGVGFGVANSAERSLNDGISLIGMRELAEHLNGTLEVQSVPGKGTAVNIRFPLKEALKPRTAENVG